jgi:GDP-D-mannose dehydratase
MNLRVGDLNLSREKLRRMPRKLGQANELHLGNLDAKRDWAMREIM